MGIQIQNPPTITGYNYYAELKRKQAQQSSGVNFSPPIASDLNKLCIQNFDTSVTVGGQPGLPINQGTVGTFQLGENFYPAPTFSGVSMTVTPQNGLTCEVHANIICTNVPQDGSANRILWLFRVHGAANWTPWAETGIPGLPFPAVNINVDFTYGGLTNGLNYDFACAYIAVRGDVGTIGTYQSNLSVAPIGILGSYLIGGAPVTPAVDLTTSVATPGGAVTDVTSEVTLSFITTNQPTDGSLSRIGIWISKDNGATWGAWATFPAVVGSASHAYTGINILDLTNGIGYAFGLTYISVGGFESNITQISSINAQALLIGTQYLRPGNGAAPSGYSYAIAVIDSVLGLTSDIELTSLTIPSQPTDGSVSGLVFFLATHGAVLQPYTVIEVQPGKVYEFTFAGQANGQSYDWSFAFLYTNGTYGALATTVTTAMPGVGIGAHYMLGGTILAPTITNQAVTNLASLNGIAASVHIDFKITNQPTDGSLSRISIFFQESGLSVPNPSFYMSVPAKGVGQANPSSLGDYTGASGFDLTDLTNGETYDFFVAMEDTQGGESALTPIGTSSVTTIDLKIVVSNNGQAIIPGILIAGQWSRYVDGGVYDLSVILPPGGTYIINIQWTATGENIAAYIDFAFSSISYSSKVNKQVFSPVGSPHGTLSTQFSGTCSGGQTVTFIFPVFGRLSGAGPFSYDGGITSVTTLKV